MHAISNSLSLYSSGHDFRLPHYDTYLTAYVGRTRVLGANLPEGAICGHQ